jgi:phage terminase small subunit
MKDKLTPKEMKFSIAYATGLTAKESAIKAGYVPKSATNQGWRLLNGNRKELILGEIEKRQEDLKLSAGLTKDWVISNMIRLYYQSLTAESHGVARDCLKLLGNEVGALSESKQVKVEHSHSFERLLSNSNIKDITPETPAITIN